MAFFIHSPRGNGTSVIILVAVNGVVSVGAMVEVRAQCGFCLSREVVCPICFPDIRSAQQLHKELPVGWYAHCDACHHRFIAGFHDVDS
jgi:hypothetical protein